MSTVEVVSTRKGLDQVVRRWPVTNAWGDLLIVHGLAEHSGRYERTGSLFAERGLDTVAIDLTGFGGSGGRRGYVPDFSAWLDDIADRLGELSPKRPHFLLGHSMGGLVTTSYLLSDRPAPTAAVVSAPALDAEIPGWKKAMAKVLDRIVPTVGIPNEITGEQLSRDPAVGEAYFADEQLVRSTTARLGSLMLGAMADVRSRVDELDVPTLVLHGADDTLVPATASEVLAGSKSVERRLLPGLRHELFNEPEGPDLVHEVASWLENHKG